MNAYGILTLVVHFMILQCSCKEFHENVPENEFLSFENTNQKFLAPVLERNVKTTENSVFKLRVDDISKKFRKSIENIKSKNKRVDIIFLIDSSSSVGKTNFESEIRFVKKLLSDFNVSYNYTRVALVTFSSQTKVIRHLDQISNPSENNDKCRLLNDDIPLLKFVGGGTYTYGALKEAQEIFVSSRNNSKKFIFLVTDGFSNGKDPVPMAEELKQENVTIFTIGIQSGNSAELLNISSTPSENHSFLLESFYEFEILARKALRTDYKIGESIKLSNYSRCDTLCRGTENDIQGENESCCDMNADCSCGASSGHYNCLCHQGYYGSGLKDQCFPCPNGTFWHVSNMCRPCPDINHITIDQPALNMEQCVCKAGFKKTRDNHCEGITCSKLTPPENGYFVKQQAACVNVLNAACGVRCKSGFQLIGTSLRLCQENGTWSGTEVNCVLKTCPSLNVPYYGSIICRNRDLYLHFDYSPRNASFMEFYEEESRRVTEPMPIDTECTYKCGPGYFMVGSRTRNCLPLSKWDGLHTTCKQVLCHPLPRPSYGEYELSDCSEMKTPFGTNCTLLCPDGFTLKGPSTKTCGGKKVGVWSNKNKLQKCVDVTPPVLTCPNDYSITMKSNDTEFVVVRSLHLPVHLADSSQMNVTYWLEPTLNETEGVKLRIGRHKFTYIASDAFNNQAKCTFVVEVIDNIPPVVEHCIDPEEFLVPPNLSTLHPERFVEWDEPTFYDNSNGNISVTKSLEPGFFAPGKYQVVYTATDLSNNINSCVLNITVKEKFCRSLSSPLNGRTFCAQNSTHSWCEITCNVDYGIFDEIEDIYLENFNLTCSHNAPHWKYETIPDCTILELPNSIEQLLTISIDSEGTFCNNSKFQSQMQNNLAENMKSHLCGDLEDCQVVSEIPDCINDEEPNDISGKSFYRISKRDISSQLREARPKVRSNVRIKLYTKVGKRLGVWRKNQPLSDNVRRVKNELQTLNSNEDLKQILSDMQIDVRRLKVDELVQCPDGSISRKYMCVQCGRGTYQDAAYNRCQLCPIGSYSSATGQTQCTPCPPYFSTRKAGRQHGDDCKQLCPPGTVAKIRVPRRKARPGVLNVKSLMPFCKKCSPGQYQPLYDGVNCLPCPPERSSMRGSRMLSECVPLEINACLRNPSVCGSFGRCVPDQMYNSLYRCLCTEGYIGAHCERRLDACISAPCYNNGICYYTNHTAIACQCPPQFTGTFCEALKESCDRLVCLNGGTCFETGNEAVCECRSGYHGRFCDEQDDYCNPSPCEAGRCFNTPDGYECECPPGLIGKRCHLRPCDYLPCHPNAFCVDLLHYPTTRESYECKCPKGLQGYDCKQIFDPCDLQPCKSNAQCVPLARRQPNNISALVDIHDADDERYEKYSCKCPPYFYGEHCDVLTTPDFVMEFPKATIKNFVKLQGPKKGLTEISFCVWVQTKDNFNYGSLISYATAETDNAFTFTDYGGFVLYVNGIDLVTDIVVNDGNWHFVCAAWTSEGGFYEIYLDGQMKNTGFNISSGQEIAGNGLFIVGQEQDEMGGGFSESECFVGKIAYFDIWDTFLQGSYVQELYTTCEPYQGNLYSWTDFKAHIQGDIKITQSEFCSPCPSNLTLSNGYVRVVQTKAFYQCNPGYALQGNSVRHCLRTSRWSLDPPFCEMVDCKDPPGIDNGFVKYTSTNYRGEAHYYCSNGFVLSGSSKKICTENGVWSVEHSECISNVQCKAFEKIPDMKIFYANYKGYINDTIGEFPVGTFAEVACTDGHTTSVVAFLSCLEDGSWDGNLPERCELEYLPTTQEVTTELFTTSSQTILTEFVDGQSSTLQTTKKPLRKTKSTSTTADISTSFTPSRTQYQRDQTTKSKRITSATLIPDQKTIFSTTTLRSTAIPLFLPDKNFWINFKSYLFSGCSPDTSLKSAFCKIQRGTNQLSDLINFEPPTSSEFQNMDIKLLNFLENNLAVFTERNEIPFENVMKLVLYGSENPQKSVVQLSKEMEDSLRFIFCIYIDSIIWDENLNVSTEEDDYLETIAGKLKVLILKISKPVYDEYLKRLLNNEEMKKSEARECNVQFAPAVPDHGLIVGVLSKKDVDAFDLDKLREKPNYLPVGSTVLYACKQGFKLEGGSISECIADGIWNSVNYSCQWGGCSEPTKPTNMFFAEETPLKYYKVGHKMHLRCSDGFIIHGNTEIQCLATKKWTRALARCTRISCNKPKLPIGSELIRGKSYLLYDKVIVRCADGKDQELICTKNGMWDPRALCV